jgi:hypothetical protein
MTSETETLTSHPLIQLVDAKIAAWQLFREACVQALAVGCRLEFPTMDDPPDLPPRTLGDMLAEIPEPLKQMIRDGRDLQPPHDTP